MGAALTLNCVWSGYTDPMNERRKLMWDTAIGFVGFFAVLALIQAIMNVFKPEPAIWPGFLAAALCVATYTLIRAKKRDNH